MPTTQKTRKRIPAKIEAEVLIQCRRRCCLCVFWDDDHEQYPGQIAHIDGDPSNNVIDNLVFLCLKHHESFDARSKQAKGITPAEVRHARTELIRRFSDSLSFIVTVRVNADYDTQRDAVVDQLLNLINRVTDTDNVDLLDVSRGSIQATFRLTAEQVRRLFDQIESHDFERLGVEDAVIEKVQDYWASRHESKEAITLRAHNAHLERVVTELTQELERMVEELTDVRDRTTSVAHPSDARQETPVKDV